MLKACSNLSGKEDEREMAQSGLLNGSKGYISSLLPHISPKKKSVLNYTPKTKVNKSF